MMRRNAVFSALAVVAAGGSLAGTALRVSAQTAHPVDEPLGATYSLGNTLWHLGHNPDAIREFQDYLAKKKVAPESLIPAAELVPPASAQRILIEPELAPADNLAAWKVEGDSITSPAGDGGTTATIPLKIVRPGLYRFWVRYYAWPGGSAVTRLQIRDMRNGGKNAPLVKDEFYDRPVAQEGPNWHSILVDFTPGEYTISLSPSVRMWQSQGYPADAMGYLTRKVDCFYLTSEIWADAPGERTLGALRTSATPLAVQHNQQAPLDERGKAAWRAWRVRPVSWEQASRYPRLFELSREFWRARVDELALKEYPEEKEKLPDYRAPERQVIFDERWNMVGNPVRIRRQANVLRGDIDTSPADNLWYWLYPGEFEKIEGGWLPQGTTLFAGYGDLEANAEQDLTVDKDATYHVWVRFRQINYYENWKLDVTAPGGQAISFVRDKPQYEETDTLPQSVWKKVGSLDLKAKQAMHFAFTGGPGVQPATYRYIYDVFVTTDAGYKPQGTVRPALSRAQYDQRLQRVRARTNDGYFMRVAPGLKSISQDWWPRVAERDDPNDAAPTRAPSGTGSNGKVTPLGLVQHPVQKLVASQNMSQSVQLYLRSTSDKPVTLSVTGMDLKDATGKSYPARIDWHVVGFVPLAAGRQDWSPAVLLHRPDITVPALNVAQIWLTVDSKGLAPGNYTGRVTLSGKGLPDQVVPIEIRVAPVTINPKQPVLVGGFTGIDGEEYMKSDVEHGLNIGYSPMTKADMQRLGIRLLILQQSSTDPGEYRKQVAHLKSLGLDYEDYIFYVLDEPGGGTAEALKEYIDVAKAIREADPKVRISFNPSEAATLATFQVLDPLCDYWRPYSLHAFYVGDREAKRAIYTGKPWMWYTTPCFIDKTIGIAQTMYDQIRLVPAQPGKVQGTEFFAFYYPFRDAWDTAYEHLGDASVMVLPSRHGPVSMPAYEGIREGSQAAALAQMVKERTGGGDDATRELIEKGMARELIEWLEKHPAR